MALPVWNVDSPNYPVQGGAAQPVKVVGGVLEDIDDHQNIVMHHLHNFEIWYGLLTPAAGGKVAQENLIPFRATTGAGSANTFGTAVLVLDTNDTPVASGGAFFDMHRVFIFNVQTARVFKMRILYSYNPRTGATYADAAAALAARNYTDLGFKVDAVNADGVPVDMIGARVPSGTKVWVQVACDNATATWVDFQIGLHEYGA